MQRVAILLVVWGLSSSGGLAANPETASTPPRFTVSIDHGMWSKWGFQYPVTYVFQLSDVQPDAAMRRRDSGAAPWKPLARKASAEFFQGVECVRFDRAGNKAFVSVGFQTSNTVELEFVGVGSAKFDSAAKYYDGRKAAYTLSLDNWGCNPWAHPGAPWKGPTDDASDNYQAALHICRSFHLPASIAINSRSAGGDDTWRNMQEELDRRDFSWEPAVHGQTHPKNAEVYLIRGYQDEILGCRADILQRLHNIPYGQHVFEHILTHGYVDETLLSTDAGEFLFLRGFNWGDNPSSTDYAPWNEKYPFYGVGGLNTKGYDTLLEKSYPPGRFIRSNVAELNEGFDRAYQAGGVIYALWHPDRFQNNVLYDSRPGIDGIQGSTLMPHLAYVANRQDVWYVANGWLYSYRYVAEHARVTPPARRCGGCNAA
jgi:hypothetical protein